MNLELKRIIDQVSRDKGIEKDLLVGAIKDAIRSAAKKKHGPRLEIEVEYRDDTGEIEVFQYKEVVAEVKDPGQEISLEEGRKRTRNARWETAWASRWTPRRLGGLRPSRPSR